MKCNKAMKYKIRIGGSNDFISKIDEHDPTWSPPGSADYVPGWNHPDILLFNTREEAVIGKDLVEYVEGIHCCVEEHASD